MACYSKQLISLVRVPVIPYVSRFSTHPCSKIREYSKIASILIYIIIVYHRMSYFMNKLDILMLIFTQRYKTFEYIKDC